MNPILKGVPQFSDVDAHDARLLGAALAALLVLLAGDKGMSKALVETIRTKMEKSDRDVLGASLALLSSKDGDVVIGDVSPEALGENLHRLTALGLALSQKAARGFDSNGQPVTAPPKGAQNNN